MMIHMFSSLLSPLVQNFAVDCTSRPRFFGLVPWYEYLDMTAKTDALGRVSCKPEAFQTLGGDSSFLLIGLAMLDNMVRLAALVAVGFVIWGGIQYITSQGAPDSTKQAQQTIINALIGLVIALLAAAIVTFIGNRIG
jgi:hypothetical protein